MIPLHVGPAHWKRARAFVFLRLFRHSAAAKSSHGPRLKQEKKKYRHQASCSQTVYIQSCSQTIYRVTYDITSCWTSTLEACPWFRFLSSFSSLCCCKALSWAKAENKTKISISTHLLVHRRCIHKVVHRQCIGLLMIPLPVGPAHWKRARTSV